MQIRVLYFASLREHRGLADEQLEIAPNSTIAQLYQQLFGGASLPPVAYARNRVLVPAHTVLQPNDEVSFLPPLGGG